MWGIAVFTPRICKRGIISDPFAAFSVTSLAYLVGLSAEPCILAKKRSSKHGPHFLVKETKGLPGPPVEVMN